TSVSAANALAVAANSHVTEVFITDSAAHIKEYLSQLETLTGGARTESDGARMEFADAHPASDVLGGITLTDSGTPTISLSESDLAGAGGVLDLITSPFILDVTGVLASDVLALSGNGLIDVLSVSDTGSNLSSNLSGLEAVAASGKLGTVTVSSGT